MKMGVQWDRLVSVLVGLTGLLNAHCIRQFDFDN